ncbi:hypothetical protein [Methanococcus maripaludis]|uniref:Uncharacterized protein n=1 Tax=Methanococcus maripaludis (strain DSM 14266 / JCM 13030 / NBRC 101832 / S2 / LL) TaxID=267377 RepID=Q6LYN0_METMP|nr:hypothetical protein [Methanococcus maripaludis]CAF30516.1 conserved hypothetical protein [Methanococcus maripaludis S2]
MVVCQKEFTNLYFKHTYPQYWNRIIEKYGLKPVNTNEFTDISPHRFIGILGDFISKNITTGPCLLTHQEIKSLNYNTTPEEVLKMLLRHPTLEDYVSIAVETKEEFKTNIIIETYEYAKLIEYKTKISFEEALTLTKQSSENLIRYYDKKLGQKHITYHLTHKKSEDMRLRELSSEFKTYFLNNANLSKKAKEIIQENPEESTWLRIKASFLPEFVKKDESTIIEPASSIEGMIHASILSNSSGIVTRSPQTLNNKPVMNEGLENEIIYLNNDISKELKKLSLPKTKKTQYGCPAYNIFAFLDTRDISEVEINCNDENVESCIFNLKENLESFKP